MGQFPCQPVLDDEVNVFAGFRWKIPGGEQAEITIAQCRGKSHSFDVIL
jgi:hypothetical protein